MISTRRFDGIDIHTKCVGDVYITMDADTIMAIMVNQNGYYGQPAKN
jgi:hypothetical protein